jgi:hypothetical protein
VFWSDLSVCLSFQAYLVQMVGRLAARQCFLAQSRIVPTWMTPGRLLTLIRFGLTFLRQPGRRRYQQFLHLRYRLLHHLLHRLRHLEPARPQLSQTPCPLAGWIGMFSLKAKYFS